MRRSISRTAGSGVIALLGVALAMSATDASAAAGASPAAAASAPAAAVPKSFKANSITWASPQQGWILGDATCGSTTCSDVIGTTNGSKTWRLLGSISAPIAEQGQASAAGITEIRFATPAVGWAFGPDLYETSDGGASFESEAIPGKGKQILDLAANSSEAFAVVSSCAWESGGNCAISLWETATSLGGKWTQVALDLPSNNVADVAVYGQTVYVVDPRTDSRTKDELYASTDGGASFSSRPVPCGDKAPDIALVEVVPSSATDVALLCDGQAGMSLADKFVYVSTNTGTTDTYAGEMAKPRYDYGIQAELAVSPSGDLAVASSSDGSFIYVNDTGKKSWTMVIGLSDGGGGWNDIVYVTDSEAWVVYAPVDMPSDLGEVDVTTDGGLHWSQVAL